MSNLIDKIQNLEKKNNDNKLELAKLEERKQALSEEKKKILDELKALNVGEDELETKLVEMEADIESTIVEIEKEIG